jgi:hypothetical protein
VLFGRLSDWFSQRAVRKKPTKILIKNGWVEITMPDGTTFNAVPEDNDSYRAMAQKLGYGTDTWAMCRDHDAMHAILADALGFPYSPALMGAAHKEPLNEVTGAEEDMVLAAQRFLQLYKKWEKNNKN